jgi:glutamate synthase (NADPH/NADH) small chain
VVIGAGNTAIDAVTPAKRLGAAAATIVYRRGESDMSCYHYEYELAKRDGCGFRFHAAPQQIIANGSGTVAAIEVRTPSGNEVIPCDMVIVAIGQGERTGLSWPKGHQRVFIGGDCANGGAEIVNAAAEGVTAAKRIHEFLGGIVR